MAQKVYIDLIGHSFIRRLQTFCRDQELLNFELDDTNFDIKFVTSTDAGNINTLCDLDILSQVYDYGRVADLIILELGSNDIHSTDIDPAILANQLVVTTDRFTQAGVAKVLLAQVMPRTQDPPYGAPSEGIRVYETRRFNDTVCHMLQTRPRIESLKHRGLIQNWREKVYDGVHLSPGPVMYSYFKSVRGAIIHHSNKIRYS